MADSATYSVLFMFKRYGCPMFVASGYINANKDIIKQSSQLDTSMMHPPPGGKAQLVCIEGLSIVICPKYFSRDSNTPSVGVFTGLKITR